jgi:phage tail-like protein
VLDIIGGAGHGQGRGSQPNVTPDITGGAGKGQGRAGSQPSLGAKVEYGGTSLSYTMKGSLKSSTSARGETSIGSATGPETSPRVADPEGNFIFALEIQDSSGKNTEVAQFREVSGLKSTTQVFELEEGGQNHRVHKLPGQSRWDNLTLRYAVCADVSLLEWRNEVLNDEFGKRRNGSVVMKTLGGEEVRRYNFVSGWPVSWEGPSFNAESAELAVEAIEIAHGGIQVT